MKKFFTLCAALLVIASLSVNAQTTVSDDVYPGFNNGSILNVSGTAIKTGTYFTGSKSTLLFDNGPLVNVPGAVGSADTSRLQTAILLMNTLGAGHQLSALNRVAEDLIVTDSAWIIDSIVFFAYQTGSTLTSTFNNYNLRVWNGIPDTTGSAIVWGDTTTNILHRTAFSNIYRNSETAPSDVTRPIMRNVLLTTGLVLLQGTYYLDWQAGGTLASGPWAPPITINGLTTTGNARQRASGIWGKLLDSGTTTWQGLPFLIYGHLPGPTSHDVGVSALVAPVDGVLTGAETVTVTLENYTATPETNFAVTYVADAGMPVTQMFTGTLSGMGTQNFIFTTTANLSAAGAHNIKAWTSLAGDVDPSNDTLNAVVQNTLSINENNSAAYIDVYPNPVIDIIRINSSSMLVSVKMFDHLGRLVLNTEPASKETLINAGTLQKGIYLMNITTENSTVVRKVIIE